MTSAFPMSMLRRLALAATLALAAAAVPAAPALADAAASGPSAVVAVARFEAVTHDFEWTDTARQRPVPARLYWPEGAASDTSVPLVVFSHGIGGSRLGYRYLGEHLARHGIAALHLQHAGSDRSLWGGNVLSLIGRLQDAASDQEAIDRVGDLRFALDELLGRSAFGPRIDRARIAGAGHSYGANTMLLVAGARVPRDGKVIDLREPRLQAVVLMSAPPIYGERDMKPLLGAVAVPSMHITTTDDVIRIPGYYSPAEDRVAVFDATGGPYKALAVFDGGPHNIFTNRGPSVAGALGERVHEASAALTLAFVQRVFDGRADALVRWPEQYRGLLARWSGP